MSESPRKIDFSEAHFLDHSLIECILHPNRRGPNKHLRYGGWRTHIAYWWMYGGNREKYIGFFYRPLFCRFGKHKYDEWTNRKNNEQFLMCRYCMDRKDETPKPGNVKEVYATDEGFGVLYDCGCYFDVECYLCCGVGTCTNPIDHLVRAKKWINSKSEAEAIENLSTPAMDPEGTNEDRLSFWPDWETGEFCISHQTGPNSAYMAMGYRAIKAIYVPDEMLKGADK